MFPSKKYSSFRNILIENDAKTVLDDVLRYHPYVHCVEIVTNNTHPPLPPDMGIYHHILLNSSIFRDENACSLLFDDDTCFISLTPIDKGNSLFIYKGQMTFVLCKATYQRFGLVGKAYNDVYIVRVNRENQSLLKRIQPCEPVEGLLIVSDMSILDKHIMMDCVKKNKVDPWQPTSPLSFDLSTISNPQSKEWKSALCASLDESLINRFSIEIKEDYQRITIEGLIQMKTIQKWITELSVCNTVLYIWDFKDSIGSFVGKKKTVQGFGGGSEVVVYGDNIGKVVTIQTVENILE